MLSPSDQAFLDELGLETDVVLENGLLAIVLKKWELPEGYEPRQSDLLVRLPPQFPDAAPDMFWFDPPVKFSGGGSPQSADSIEQHLGRQWQRFSRHLAPGVWNPGRDSLRSYLALIRRDLEANVPR